MLPQKFSAATTSSRVWLLAAAGPPTTNVAPASAAPAKLRGCTFVERSALEHAVGNRFAVAHDSGDSLVAAGCHFPSKRIGGTDLGLYVSADVRAGIAQSYEGRFFATED